MCGLIGAATRVPIDEKNIELALEKIQHRGPDGEGRATFQLEESTLFFGHKRLAIIDLSDAGHQPFQSPSADRSIVFNGEIYNYLELREQLKNEGVPFRSESDTEVLIEALAHWGVDALPKLVGMFAFAYFDGATKTLIIARDHFGIKPMYYSKTNTGFFFGSEPAALFPLSQRIPEVNQRQAIQFLLDGVYDQGNETFFKGIYQLLPGALLEVNLKTLEVAESQWLKHEHIFLDQVKTQSISDSLESAVRLNLRSDVPVAAALSGGIDSSALVGLVVQDRTPGTFETFGYVSKEPESSEKKWQEIVTEKMKLRHTFVESFEGDPYEELCREIFVLGEPFSSTSLLAQNSVFCAMSQRGFKVSIDGQGADELFGGYDGYPQAKFLSQPTRTKVRQLREGGHYSASAGASRTRFLAEVVAEWLRLGSSSNWLTRLLRIVVRHHSHLRYLTFSAALQYVARSQRKFLIGEVLPDSHSPLVRKLAEEVWITSLPALLKHADRNSMTWSLESRVPFLTPAVAGVALWTAGTDSALSSGKKTQLVSAIRHLLPSEIADRQDKIGFRGERFDAIQIPQLERIRNIEALQSQKWLTREAIGNLAPEGVIRDSREFRLITLALWIRAHIQFSLAEPRRAN